MPFGLSAELCGRGELAAVALLCKKRVVPLILSSLEYSLCFELDLPDPLPRNIQLFTEVCERSGFTLVQAVPAHQYVPIALGEPLYSLSQLGALHLLHHGARGIVCPLVLHQLAKLRAVHLRTQGLVEAHRIGHSVLYVTHLADGPFKTLGYLFVCGVALELCGELVVGAGHLPYLLGHVHGDPYGAPLLRYCPPYRLPDPPGGIRGEPKAPLRVVLLHRLHKPYVALLDKILKGQPVPAVLLGHRDNKPQVLLYEPLASPLVADLGPL